MIYDVFICYSRRDSSIADEICKVFDAQGIKYYIDRKMQIGSEFTDHLADAISASRMFLFLVSENSTSSFYVKCELHYANKRISHNFILPYLIDSKPVPPGIDLMLSPLNQLNIYEHPIHSDLIDHIKNLLETDFVDGKDTAGMPFPMEFAMQGMRSFSENRFEEAFIDFTIAAEQGHIQSQYQLGVCYEMGHGAPRNMTMAARNYRKAAENGHPEAQAKLARLLFDGYYIPCDYGEAVRFFKLAAEKGNREAQAGLAQCYESGRGVAQSIKNARYWYSAAALQGDADAMRKLRTLK